MKNQQAPSKSLRVSNFTALKKAAYQAAVAGKQCGYNDEWKKQYIDCYSISSVVFLFERAVTVYQDFLQGDIQKEEGESLFQQLEEKFTRICMVLGSAHEFAEAAIEAFGEKGMQFGEVEFDCPDCFSKAKAIRLNTPKNPSHAVTIRASCYGCGTRMMN
ncbi:hypothetical protein [Aneurinibacillus tyrosinisolvens]|uniref:hypothetical protein n=1 Tax=Aneurinibacillus tyrosinisolvens TaxID=1443435 RepID=UPI00063FA12C|nr:hypothetical protein [Aneurinibacillus tyrosinisolvens]